MSCYLSAVAIYQQFIYSPYSLTVVIYQQFMMTGGNDIDDDDVYLGIIYSVYCNKINSPFSNTVLKIINT